MTTFVHHPSPTEPRNGPVNGADRPLTTGPSTSTAAAAPGTAGTAPTDPGPPPATPRSDLPTADAQLQKAVRQSGHLRRGFYIVVLLVALAGQVTGAMQTLHIPLLAALPAVAALELGGVVVLANADVRRRLGERALGSRILSAAIAAGAVAFNWLAHTNRLAGGFFAGMSALGYLVWVTHAENSRRDRLRALGDLPPTTPAYEIVGHWLRHPWLARRARSLAKADPNLGLYGSLAAARNQLRAERRRAAISKVLHRKIRAAVDPVTADIAVAVYDLDHIADRLADRADYDGLTALIADDLTPARLAAAPAAPPRRRRHWWRGRTGADTPAALTDAAARPPEPPAADTEAVPVTAPPARADDADTAAQIPVPQDPAPASASVVPPRDTAPHFTDPQPLQPALAVLPTPTRVTPPHLVLVHTDTGMADAAVPDRPGSIPRRDTVIADHPSSSTTADTEATDILVAGTSTPHVLPAEPPGTADDHAARNSVGDGVADTKTDADTTEDRADDDGADDNGAEGNGADEDGGVDDGADGDSVPEETAAAVAYWFQREPGLHPRDIGARIGRSERTVRRYWPPTANPDPDR